MCPQIACHRRGNDTLVAFVLLFSSVCVFKCLLKIRHLMQLSDLDNLLSVWTIYYQLGESYLNVFLLRKMDNLLSVYKFYQNWIIMLSSFNAILHSSDEEGVKK